jgi:PAS domain S-box-containing protein
LSAHSPQKPADVPIRDPIAQRQVPQLQFVLFFLLAASCLRLVFFFNTDRASIGMLPTIIIDAITLICPIVALLILRRGHFYAATLLTALELLLTIVFATIATGLRHSGMLPLVFALPIVFTGLLVDWRGLALICVASCAVVLGIAALEDLHSPLVAFAPSPEQPFGMASIFVFITALLFVLLSRFGRDYRHDLVAHRRTEVTLRQSEAQFATVFRASPAAMSITRLRDGVFVDVNTSYTELLEFRRAELIGQDIDALNIYVNTSERANVVRRVREEGPQRNLELALRAKSGALHDALISMEALDVDGELCILSIAFDITDRKRAEAALRESEDRFAKAFRASPIALMLTHLGDGRIIDMNASYCRLLGYEPEEAIGRTVFELNLYVDPHERAALVQTIRAEGRVRERETLLRTKSGALREVLWSLETFDTQGQACILTTAVDITARKQAENMLRQTAEELRRSNAELEQFAYVASHDLQEPLRAVAGMVQLLQQRYGGQLDARADQYITHAVEGANRMQTLINDLLAFSRLGTRRQQFAPTAVADALRAALANLAVAIHETGASVTYADLPTVQADATQLTQLLQNLIGNAIKFRGDQPPAIHIGAERLANAWQISVRDNGIGIDPQYFERIFVVFQRLHTRRAYPGTGIGLALCKKIVERHGGRIWVDSTPGQGTVFSFTLPDRKASDAN